MVTNFSLALKRGSLVAIHLKGIRNIIAYFISHKNAGVRIKVKSGFLSMGPSEGTLSQDRPFCDITESSATNVGVPPISGH